VTKHLHKSENNSAFPPQKPFHKLSQLFCLRARLVWSSLVWSVLSWSGMEWYKGQPDRLSDSEIATQFSILIKVQTLPIIWGAWRCRRG